MIVVGSVQPNMDKMGLEGQQYQYSNGAPFPVGPSYGGPDISSHMQSPQRPPPQQQFVLTGDFLPRNFRTQSAQIAKDTIHYICRHDNCLPPPSKTTLIMRNLLDDTLKNRLDMMRNLVTTLDVQSREQLELLHNIATNMFDDQLVNWGRIVTFHAFCGYLARYCEERHIPDCGDLIAEILANIVVNRLGLWIVANGGWAAFEAQFPPVCMWETNGLWKGIAIVALLIGAILAFYSSIRFMGSGG